MTSPFDIDLPGFASASPEARQAMAALGRAGSASTLGKDLLELVKIRASQLNGCAYCLQYHMNLARGLHVPQAKLDLISVWWEFDTFTAPERAALAFTEALTAMADHGAIESAAEDVAAHFTAEEARAMVIAIATINTWNRLGVAFRFKPDAAK